MHEPDIQIRFGQQRKVKEEPVLIWAGTPVNVQTALRRMQVFAFNAGAAVKGFHQLTVWIPKAIRVEPADGIAISTKPIVFDGEEYVEVLMESQEMIERNKPFHVIQELTISGLTDRAKVYWKFTSQNYENEGSVVIQLPGA